MKKIVYISETAGRVASLVVDIGNSSFRMALYADGKIFDRYDCAMLEDEDFMRSLITKLAHYRKTTVVNGIAIASVTNPKAASFLIDLVLEPFPLTPLRHFEGNRDKLPMKFTPGFTQKNKVGADRLANAMAVIALKKFPCVIADFGTALTVDGVNENGEFIGGMILPGMNTMLRSMHSNAALLPELKVPSKPFQKRFGDNTKDAMLAGVEHGYRGLVCETVQTLQQALCGKCALLATGGMAGRVATASGLDFEILPDLTLLGIAQVFNPGETT